MKKYIVCTAYASDAFDPDSQKRRQIAHNTNDKDLLEIYTYDPEYDVRGAVASNPNTSAEILTVLSDDPCDYVRNAVANNPNTSLSALVKLANAHNITSLYALKNPTMPEDVKNKIITDNGYYCILNIVFDPPESELCGTDVDAEYSDVLIASLGEEISRQGYTFLDGDITYEPTEDDDDAQYMLRLRIGYTEEGYAIKLKNSIEEILEEEEECYVETDVSWVSYDHNCPDEE